MVVFCFIFHTHIIYLCLLSLISIFFPFFFFFSRASGKLVYPKVSKYKSHSIFDRQIVPYSRNDTHGKLAPLLYTPTPTFGALRIFNFAAIGSTLILRELKSILDISQKKNNNNNIM